MSTSGDPRRVFKGIVKNPVSAERVDVFDPGYLVVSGASVEALSSSDPRSEMPSEQFVDLGKKVIIPGFVDTHVHLPQFAIMGIGTGELLEWLRNYTFPEEERFADPEYAREISRKFF